MEMSESCWHRVCSTTNQEPPNSSCLADNKDSDREKCSDAKRVRQRREFMNELVASNHLCRKYRNTATTHCSMAGGRPGRKSENPSPPHHVQVVRCQIGKPLINPPVGQIAKTWCQSRPRMLASSSATVPSKRVTAL